MPTEPSRARRQLGYELKRARTAAGLTLRAFTRDDPEVRRRELPGIAHPRLQRAEQGAALLTDDQLATFVALVSPGAAVVERLEVLLAHARSEETRWSLAMDGEEHLQQVAADRERDTGWLCVIEVAYLPGLLQTEPYARALFRQLRSVVGERHDDDAATLARMRRQELLFDPAHEHSFLLPEHTLTWAPGPEVSMGAQRDRITQLAGLDGVEVRVLAPMSRLPLSGFQLHERMVDGTAMVAVELEHGERAVVDPELVEHYRQLFALLWGNATPWDNRYEER